MPAGQAINMLQQLMSQLGSGQFAQQQMDSLSGAGLGAINAKKIFREDPQTAQMRQAVMQRVLGYYGGNPTGGMAGGNPQGLQAMPGHDIYQTQQQPGDAIFRQQGPPQLQGSGQLDPSGGYQQFGGMGDTIMGPPSGGEQTFGRPGIIDSAQGAGITPYYGQPSITGDQPYRNFPNGASSTEDMINRLFQQQGGSTQGLSPQQQQQQAQQSVFQGAGSTGQLPGLDPQTQGQINSIYQPQMDQMNLDFGQQKESMLNDLFGRGMAQSTPATDAAGKLLYGRSSAMNQIGGQKAAAELDQRNKLMDMMSKMSPQQLGTMGGGGGGGGMIPPNAFGGTPDGALTASLMGQIANTDRPMNFEQAMQMKQLQLQRDSLSQQGALGFGGLDLQRMLGMGSQGIQQQGMGQDLMMQMLGLQQQGRQSQAGLQSSEAARMQQYLMGQQGMQAQLGGQQAQIESQRKSMLSQILGGIMGGASSLLGAAGGAGGFGALFGGGGGH